jgi:methanethiol S-methyltransferase
LLKRSLVLTYGAAVYLIGMASLFYMIFFICGWLVPHTFDSAQPGQGLSGYLINLSFLTAFAVQHTIMARPAFKQWWTKIIPEAAERSTFVLATALILFGFIYYGRSYSTPVWNIENNTLWWLLTGISIFGFAIGVLSSFLIDHFDLFGLKQVFRYFKNNSYEAPKFVQPWLYTKVRNPLMLGFLTGFWATPYMSQGRLFFVVILTGYVFFGVWMEERDLGASLGEPYLEYRKKTPMLIPFKIFR